MVRLLVIISVLYFPMKIVYLKPFYATISYNNLGKFIFVKKVT